MLAVVQPQVHSGRLPDRQFQLALLAAARPRSVGARPGRLEERVRSLMFGDLLSPAPAITRHHACLKPGCFSSHASSLRSVHFPSENGVSAAFLICDMAVTPIPDTTASSAPLNCL